MGRLAVFHLRAGKFQHKVRLPAGQGPAHTCVWREVRDQ